MAVKVTSRSGKTVTLLNPAEKGRKAAAELKAGIKCTNDHKVKRNADGSVQRLTKDERAWRAGYLAARSDSAKAWKSQQKKAQPKRTTKKTAGRKTGGTRMSF